MVSQTAKDNMEKMKMNAKWLIALAMVCCTAVVLVKYQFAVRIPEQDRPDKTTVTLTEAPDWSGKITKTTVVLTEYRK